MYRHSPLYTALCCVAPLLLSTDARAQETVENELTELDQIEVAADPLGRRREDLIRPTSVLNGAELDRRRGGTLGDTLDQEVGVHSSAFGPGAGRPIIRGLDGTRVEVLADGISSQDVSTVSVDHAVSIDPFVAERIEVLKGPATLIYGSGAIGGAVNVVDGRVPRATPADGLQGRAQIYADSGADTRGAAARLDVGSSRLVLHADAFTRDSDDYEIPGFANAQPDAEDRRGIVPNSAVETSGGALGFSVIGDRGYIGIAVSQFDTFYGVPGEGEEEEERGLAKSGEGEVVRIDLNQQRWDIAGELQTDQAWARQLRLRIAQTDYEHIELEGDEIGTRFDNDQIDWRLEIEHAPIGSFRGVYGFTYANRDLIAVGEEAFVPPSETDNRALFLIETAEFGAWNVEAGIRIEDQRIRVQGAPDASHNPLSLSLGTRLTINDQFSWSANLQRAQRAPNSEELFANGPHIATRTFEIGDTELREETARQFELGLHYDNERVHAELSAYISDFDDFIYLEGLGSIEDGLPVRQWTQQGAQFKGLEGSVSWHMPATNYGHFDFTLRGDVVRAELDDGSNLPRISPARMGLGLAWTHQAWSANLDLTRVSEQKQVAQFEGRTSGYNLIDFDLTYGFDLASIEVELYAQGRNLADTQARFHTSLLRDFAPVPGRSVTVGLRSFF